MDLSKAYYVVKFKHFDHEVDVISEGEEIFNNFSLPIRFRREEALNYFYELITKYILQWVFLNFLDILLLNIQTV